MNDVLTEHLIDTRPIFARGESPREAIEDAAAGLMPGQTLALIVPFEPAPLYAKLNNQGFTHQATELPNGTWRVELSLRKDSCPVNETSIALGMKAGRQQFPGVRAD
jgi:uncharacterized protein (DUF2249 family)